MEYGRIYDFYFAGVKVPLEVGGVVLCIPETPFYEREELEGKIWRAISEKLCNGGNPRKVAFHFTDLVKLMDKFGFKYEGNDDDDESINFSDSYGEFVIWPTTYYPKMDLLRIDNSHLT